MPRVLTIDPKKCVGCRECELICSAKHEGKINPQLSRIHIVKWIDRCEPFPIVCAQCELGPCMSICPATAIFRDETLGRMSVDYDKCIGCRMCISICPFGAMTFNNSSKKVIKCDFCDGEPGCVDVCVNKALEYVEAEEQSKNRQKSAADKYTRIIRGIA